MIISIILIIMVLVGISSMSKVKTSVFGNNLSALSMLIATIYIIYANDLLTSPLIWIAILIGFALGYFMAIKVKMIQMPETVAMLNAFGGLASALVAIISINQEDNFVFITGFLAIFIGIVTFIGSMVAAGKLSKKLPSKPFILNAHSILITISLLLTLILFLISAFKVISLNTSITILAVLSVIFAILFSIRVGGADMPIVISLLNSTSGVAGSISGMVIFNPLLISVGAIVGASGLILTQIMCKAMNRNLKDILLGKTSVNKKDDVVELKKEFSKPKEIESDKNEKNLYDDIKKVLIVPGYGMALSQAQSKVKELMNALESKNAEVKFAIHPVAGRMPGHMNVLLAEVDIDYEKFIELEEANKEFEDTDLVIAIGANDVINPSANTAENTPIYGMPILEVSKARNIIICNYDKKPGYAGVENPLYEDDKTRLILGDAKESISKILNEINEADISKKENKAINKDQNLKEADTKTQKNLYDDIKKVLIVPGYGMALSQAQSKVKELMNALESKNAEVKFAIHPVAGRMPGHMNVLLAEVDIDYEKFIELEEANKEFEDTDLVIAIGANDVINPSANTAENTPIYGMPILEVSKARNIIICNYDKKPGYAGVENPLYEDDKTRLILGDAKESIDLFIKELTN
ncbi:MAG: NAD(P)(+) transhydrogenase (Re/Si-specific) subunit beta [Tissierellia bacterium]|nr:NAD(P)(+) transhydrogenase (Re/Si-specific) subunit beta [Tissierellia bacterium]